MFVLILNANVRNNSLLLQINFNSKALDLKRRLKKSQCSRETRDSFLEPTVNPLAPPIVMAIGAESKTHQVGQDKTTCLKSIAEGKILNLTEKHG